jgi:hypothetical protein
MYRLRMFMQSATARQFTTNLSLRSTLYLFIGCSSRSLSSDMFAEVLQKHVCTDSRARREMPGLLDASPFPFTKGQQILLDGK